MPDNLPLQSNQEILLQQDQHQYEIAKLNIEKTYENNVMWAQHWAKLRCMAYIFSGMILLIILTFCSFALYMGKDAIALEIIKAGIFLTAGGGIGFAIGYRKGQNPDQN